MSTCHWRISLLKNGRPITLYATTTDEMVDLDLNSEVSHSFICGARQFHRQPQTQQQDHRDLAIGAIMFFASEPVYDRSYAHITRVNAVPLGEPSVRVAKNRNGVSVPVWEMAEGEDAAGGN